MTQPPRSPDPELVACFLDPNSLTCVARGGPWVRGTVHAHMVSARRLGLIERVGSRASGWGPPRKLYAVTPRGLEWLEAHRVIEVLLLGER